jgi:hypothetical protein
MAYQATIIPIMVASPGDVYEEREVVRDVIHTWNYIHSASTRVMLTPAGWETHSSPELGMRPQELINSRILKDCDLLVGIFWTRLGTPTGEAGSGTVEEIEKHLKAGKPAMIYFSSRPAAPETVDPDQYKALKEFKNRCRHLGLIEEFENIVDLKDKFSRQLQLCLNKNGYLRSILVKSTGEISATSIDAPEPEQARSRLSEEARVLLKAAASRDDGTIIKISVMGGKFIQAGGQSFGGERGRESARWEHALNELVNEGLAMARGNRGEIFELTHEGWGVADELK